MSDNELNGSIAFSLSTNLKPWHRNHEEYWLRVDGTVSVFGDDDGDDETKKAAGRMELVIIKMTEAVNDHVNLREVWFSCGEMDVIYGALFNKKQDFKEKLGVEFFPGDIVYVQSLTLASKYLHTPLLCQIIEAMSSTFASTGLVVAFKETLDLGGKEWSKMGFKIVPDTEDIIFRDNFDGDPRDKMY